MKSTAVTFIGSLCSRIRRRAASRPSARRLRFSSSRARSSSLARPFADRQPVDVLRHPLRGPDALGHLGSRVGGHQHLVTDGREWAPGRGSEAVPLEAHRHHHAHVPDYVVRVCRYHDLSEPGVILWACPEHHPLTAWPTSWSSSPWSAAPTARPGQKEMHIACGARPWQTLLPGVYLTVSGVRAFRELRRDGLVAQRLRDALNRGLTRPLSPSAPSRAPAIQWPSLPIDAVEALNPGARAGRGAAGSGRTGPGWAPGAAFGEGEGHFFYG